MMHIRKRDEVGVEVDLAEIPGEAEVVVEIEVDRRITDMVVIKDRDIIHENIHQNESTIHHIKARVLREVLTQ